MNNLKQIEKPVINSYMTLYLFENTLNCDQVYICDTEKALLNEIQNSGDWEFLRQVKVKIV